MVEQRHGIITDVVHTNLSVGRKLSHLSLWMEHGPKKSDIDTATHDSMIFSSDRKKKKQVFLKNVERLMAGRIIMKIRLGCFCLLL